MDKKEVIEEFINSFIRTLNITSLYSKGHPLLLKTVDDFKKTLDFTLNYLSPLIIGATIDSLLVNQKKFSGPECEKLAKSLHLRKIKNIQIKKGITSKELSLFLNKMSTPIKDLIKNGGIAHILNKERMAHLFIEELDYSELLTTVTGEHKHIWGYLLSEAVDTDDYLKVTQLTDMFGKTMRHFTFKELSENIELLENIQKFLGYLKHKDKEKFSRCSKEMAKHIFNARDVFSQSELEKIRGLFNSCTESDFADILTDEISNVDEFDSLSLDLFSKIIDTQKHSAVAASTIKSLSKKSVEDKQKARNKIASLLRASDKSSFSEVYRNTLSSFLKDISSGKSFSFDRNLVYANYRLILLNLLQWESKGRLGRIIEGVSKVLGDIAQDMDFEYFELLLDIVKKRKAEDSQVALLFDGLDKQIADFVENNIWNEQLPADFQYLADYLQFSTLGIDSYLNKMFVENKVSAAALKLFLKFFSDNLPLFYKNLEKKHLDIAFIMKLINSLKTVDNPLVLDILEQIYLFSNDYIKIQVLRTMQELDIFDKGFLISILQKDNVPLKREALLMLMNDEKAKKEALEALFSIKLSWFKRLWKRKNRVLLDNITVVEEVGLKQAGDYLIAISKKHFFWNWNIKRKAKEVLNKWK